MNDQAANEPVLPMHADEVHTDAELVRRLVVSQFLGWAERPITPVCSAGTSNALYRLEPDLVVRLPRIPGAVDDVDREFTWVPRLASRLPVPTPLPVAKGVAGEGYPWPWTVCQWLDGTNPVIDDLRDPAALTQELAAFIVALRKIDTKGGPASARGGPLVERDAATRQAISELEGMIDTARATAAWEQSLKAEPWSGAAVWTHGDLSPGNVLCDNAGHLSAVIDFGSLGVGEPAVDLIAAWNLLPRHQRSTFRSQLDIDDATWMRGRGWALSVALIQLPYYKDTNPGMADNARHIINEVLSDLQDRD